MFEPFLKCQIPIEHSFGQEPLKLLPDLVVILLSQ